MPTQTADTTTLCSCPPGYCTAPRSPSCKERARLATPVNNEASVDTEYVEIIKDATEPS